MVEYVAFCSATSADAWALIARPGRWHEWAPHLRGAWGLGSPEVELGARGAARLLAVVPVPAKVVAKQPGRSWTWQVGLVALDHRVEPRGEGCRIVIGIDAPAPLLAVLRITYGPIVGLLVERLARRAEQAGR